MKNYKLTIPKPCHEDWNTMTPNEKGKFCSSCSKTVVDFTQKSSKEIQEYLVANKGQRVCGHFYRKQLDSIVIQLPETTFYQSLTFQKLFILSLLFTMGTTLLSCKTETGKKQKIEKVEIIDSIPKVELVIDSLKIEKDTIVKKRKRKVPPPPAITEITIIETTGEVQEELVEPFDINKIEELPEEEELEEDILLHPKDSIPEVEIMGDIIEGEVVMESNEPYSFFQVDLKPRFKKSEVSFEEDINKFIKKKMDHGLLEKLDVNKKGEKVYTQFTIDTTGNIFNIKVRASLRKVEKWITKVIEDLPQLIPAQIGGKNVSVKYTLSVIFKED